MSKAANRKASRRGAKRARTQPVLDCVSRVLIENGVPLTQRNWIEFAYLGDKCSIDELDAEELANAPDGFEDWPIDDLVLLCHKMDTALIFMGQDSISS